MSNDMDYLLSWLSGHYTDVEYLILCETESFQSRSMSVSSVETVCIAYMYAIPLTLIT